MALTLLAPDPGEGTELGPAIGEGALGDTDDGMAMGGTERLADVWIDGDGDEDETELTLLMSNVEPGITVRDE